MKRKDLQSVCLRQFLLHSQCAKLNLQKYFIQFEPLKPKSMEHKHSKFKSLIESPPELADMTLIKTDNYHSKFWSLHLKVCIKYLNDADSWMIYN